MVEQQKKKKEVGTAQKGKEESEPFADGFVFFSEIVVALLQLLKGTSK